ncbi:hypothetical protein HMPREF9445_03087 [Bacteroides clarus YIT 12056]|uniref:Uncharacterized protein n=1 Tax=Bacteroides clarus YIT 12056 TaxID=762984 RepID=A0ABP2KML5_9BACE|nr:hypothetical protein HMPREF9445_03087 [Bacteroides clarus YIT 12056]
MTNRNEIPEAWMKRPPARTHFGIAFYPETVRNHAIYICKPFSMHNTERLLNRIVS